MEFVLGTGITVQYWGTGVPMVKAPNLHAALPWFDPPVRHRICLVRDLDRTHDHYPGRGWPPFNALGSRMATVCALYTVRYTSAPSPLRGRKQTTTPKPQSQSIGANIKKTVWKKVLMRLINTSVHDFLRICQGLKSRCKSAKTKLKHS